MSRAIQRGLVPVGLLAAALLACKGGSDELLLVGTVERTLIEIAAPVSETILAIEVARGEALEAGEVVVRLDPTFALADLAQAEAAAAAVRTANAVAEQDFRRAQQLHRNRVVSDQELDQAQLHRDEAAARLWEADARLDAVRKRLRDHTLVSPVVGVVDQLPFDQGERVPAGAVVTVILAEGEPWVRVWLPERAIARVGPGSPAEVRIDGIAQALPARVLEVAREPEFTPHFALTERERVHLVYETRVSIGQAPAGLRPGSPAEVRIPLATSEAVVRHAP